MSFRREDHEPRPLINCDICNKPFPKPRWRSKRALCAECFWELFDESPEQAEEFDKEEE